MPETFSYSEEQENISPSISSIQWSMHTENFLRWLLPKRGKKYDTARLEDLIECSGVRLIKQYGINELIYREIEDVVTKNGLEFKMSINNG